MLTQTRRFLADLGFSPVSPRIEVFSELTPRKTPLYSPYGKFCGSRAVVSLVALLVCGCGDAPATSATDTASGTSATGATTRDTGETSMSPTGGSETAASTQATAGPTETGSNSETTGDPTDASSTDPSDSATVSDSDSLSESDSETTDPTATTDTDTTDTTDPTDPDPTDPTDTTDTTDTTDPTTDSTDSDATTEDATDSETGQVMCEQPGDCPLPPECMLAVCQQGECGLNPSPAGVSCNGDDMCDGSGNCVECLDGGDCPDGVCEDGICQQASCEDGVQNGSETDSDCGGNCPEKCEEGQGCENADDCVTDSCEAGVCVVPGAACLNAPPNPETGQGCPLFSECNEFSDCGVFQDCQQWYCDSGQCALNTLSNCWDTVGGQCVADVVLTQHVDPPVNKDFLPPDGIDFREVGSLTFTVQNNTGNDIYLDKVPLQLDTMGGGSSFDVSSLKMYQDFGGSDWETPGDFYFCLTGNPFQFPANGVLGPCGGSFAARVAKNGGTRRFVITFAFAKEKTFIAGRSYRLRLDANADLEFRVGNTQGPPLNGTQCGVPNSDFVGAWVNAKNL